MTFEDYIDGSPDVPFTETPGELERRNRDLEKRGGVPGLIPGWGPRALHTPMLVGEAGGINEHRQGRPFCGKAGSVLTSYMRAAGLVRSDFYITNVYPRWPGKGNPDPTAEQIRAEEWRLERDIAELQPPVIGAVGAVAARWFLGPDLTLDTMHGVPLWSDRAPGSVVVPLYHPAAGFYEPSKAALCQDDFLRLSHYLKNPVTGRIPPDVVVTERDEIAGAPHYFDGAVDTEGLESDAWGLSYSRDGKSGEVYAPSRIRSRFLGVSGRITFHHALHDLKILRAMGVRTDRIDPDDTMVMAFVLQLEPQSLKALAYRHLGLKMHEFDEVVRPHFNKEARRWLLEASCHDYPKPKAQAVEDYSKKKNRIYQPWGAGRRIEGILKSFRKKPEDTRLEKRWADLPEEFRVQAEVRVGRPFPAFSIHCVPREEAIRYSGTDAVATAAIKPILSSMLKERGLERIYEMDRGALKFIDRMQATGMRVNVEKLREIEAELEGLRDTSRKRVQRVVGDRWFNPGSHDQVAAWLYDVRGLPIKTFTDKGRGSSSDDALQMLKGYFGKDDPDVFEFVQGVQDYREADKLDGSFVKRIFDRLQRSEDGWRVHDDFKATRVVSGRLSSWLLTIPTRSKLGKKIRDAFEAAPGFKILSVDMSQIELRVGAHYSRDARMRQAFENGEDLHALTASIIFNVPLAKVSKTQRYIAKTINFAVFYGISAQALLDQLYKADIFSYSKDDCQRFINEWFKIYGSVRAFQRRLWDQAEKDGFVRNLFGRICYVPNLRLTDSGLRESAQRLAGNFPVQSSASDLVKRSEIRLYDWLDEEELWDRVHPWLQMHDELVLEVVDDLVEEMKRDVMTMMTADQKLIRVPIVAEGGIGPSWGEAKG